MPDSREIRPTLDRVREALFSIIGPRVTEARFLDLFAGTGANGIEALSRGAASATFVENDSRAVRLIQQNLQRTRLTGHATILRLTVPRDLGKLTGGPFDIIFADPPHAFGEWTQTLHALTNCDALAPGGIIVYEQNAKSEPVEACGPLVLTRRATYGATALAFYAYNEKAAESEIEPDDPERVGE